MIVAGLIHHITIGKYVIHSLASAVSLCFVFMINCFFPLYMRSSIHLDLELFCFVCLSLIDNFLS